MSSLFLDRKYLNLLSPQLRNFKQKKDNLWNFSCPFCGDSQKKQFKARGYAYPKDDALIFKCHNCGQSSGMHSLIKQLNPSLYSQYCLESFNHSRIITSPTPKISKATSMFNAGLNIPLETIRGLCDGHWVKDYVQHRRIPESFWSSLYFAPDFKKFVDHIYPEHKKDLPADDPRLVIPFYNEHNVLCGFQGRALANPEIRYITIKISEDALKCYGMEKVDVTERIYVLEGPIDSMFLPNAVATCDSDLTKCETYLPKEKLVLVYDNEYFANEIRKQLNRSIEKGFQVCIFPKMITQKDLNQMVIEKSLTLEQIKSIVDENVYSGLRAKTELLGR